MTGLAEYLDLVLARLDAVGAVLALIAAIFSALSASVSAQYAKQVAERANQESQLNAWREARRTAASTKLDFPVIRETLVDADRTWRSAAVQHGTVGGSRVKLRTDAIEEKRQELENLDARLAALDLGLDSMRRLKPDQVTQLHAELDALQLETSALLRRALNDSMEAEAETRPRGRPFP